MATGKPSGNAIKAGEAFVELNADDSKFMNVLEKSSNKFKRFGGLIRNIGLGITGIGTAIVAPLITASFATLKYLDSINDVADRTNASTEAVSRLSYAAKLSATSLEDIEAGNKKLTKSAVDAANGSEEQAEAFKMMGVSAEDFLALDMDERFVQIAETLEGIESPLERSKFLIAILGKQAATLTPLLLEGGEGLRKLFREAESVGAVIRGDDAKKAAEAMDAFDKVMTSVKSTLIEVGLAVFSLGEDTKEGQRIVLMYLSMARDWIKENKKVVAIIAIVGGVLVVLGTVLVGIGVILGIIGGAISGVVAIAGAVGAVLALITVKLVVIVAVIAALVVGIGALIYAFFTMTELGRNIAKIWGDTFTRIWDSFTVMWGGIVGALKKGDLKLAADIAVLGLYIAFEETIVSLKETWFRFLNFFLDGWSDTVGLIRLYFAKLVSFIKIAGLQAVLFVAEKATAAFKALDIAGDLTKQIDAKLKELEKTIEAEVTAKANLKVEVDEEQNKRKEQQKEEIKGDKDDIKGWIDHLKELTKKANEPIVVVPQLPTAPMPHEPGRGNKLDTSLSRLGDSAKGLFNSADFKGALGLGEANSYAKKSYDLQRDMLAELSSINRKTGDDKFD